MSDININIIDRERNKHSIVVPTDMNMNLMEACKSYEFPIDGICGGMAKAGLVSQGRSVLFMAVPHRNERGHQ